MAGSRDIYGDEGSVPNPVPIQGSGAGQLGVRASPENFGGQIGKGIENVGQTAGGLAEEYGKIVNENAMMQADIGFTTKLGQLKADFTSKSGQAAYDAYPQYQKDIAAAFQESRANLPLGAQHGFDMLGGRTMGNHIADGSAYATSQLKEQQRYDGSDLTNKAIQGILGLSPQALADPNGRTAEHTGDAIWGLQKTLDTNHPGLKTDPDTGEVSFDESKPEGIGLKAQYEAQKNDIITKIQSNRFDVLSKNDALGAYGMYLNERADLPKQTQITLDAKFEPIVFNAHKDNAVGHAVAQSQDDYARILYNPSIQPVRMPAPNIGSNSNDNMPGIPEGLGNPSGVKSVQMPNPLGGQGAQPLSVRNNNPGNLRDFTTGQFRVFSTPEEGAKAMQDDLTAKINGNSTAMETKLGKGYSPTLSNIITTYAPASDNNNTAAYIDTVSKDTGFAPNQVLTAADVPKLQAAMTKVEAGGSSGGTSTPQKSYATNPDGSMLKQADYYRTNSADVLAHGDAYAESVMPGDLAFKRSVRETLGNYMSKTIANQSQQYIADNKDVMRGITGELTKGQIPGTEQELRAIPGMNDLLNRVSAQDPKFSETIPRKIAEAQRQNTTTNSANMYPTLLRTLEPHGSANPNAISSDDHLDRLVGQLDGSGINMKDRTDLHPAVELPDAAKKTVLQHVKDIATANGDIDGKGEQRAIQWFNQVMTAYKQNEALGDKKDPDFFATLKDRISLPQPSIMQQISNAYHDLIGTPPPPPDAVRVIGLDGKTGTIPANQLQDALNLGYMRAK